MLPNTTILCLQLEEFIGNISVVGKHGHFVLRLVSLHFHRQQTENLSRGKFFPVSEAFSVNQIKIITILFLEIDPKLSLFVQGFEALFQIQPTIHGRGGVLHFWVSVLGATVAR
ncbi:MAG: hypothetical protein R2781_11495 [Flavobacteriaceae bacterium]